MTAIVAICSKLAGSSTVPRKRTPRITAASFLGSGMATSLVSVFLPMSGHMKVAIPEDYSKVFFWFLGTFSHDLPVRAAGRACPCDNWTVEKQSSRTGPHVYSTTGLPAVAMDALHERVADRFPTCDRPGGRPPVLLCRQEVQISMMCTRRNRIQGRIC